jgi:hypothetical protein
VRFQRQEYTFEMILSILTIVTISLLTATIAASVFLLILNIFSASAVNAYAQVIVSEDLQLIPLPYCDTSEGEASAEGCHDRFDFDDETGLFPFSSNT